MYDTFARDLSTVLEHGGTIPPELTALQERGTKYTEYDHNFTGRYAEAVVNNAPEDEILNLRALALVEQTVTPVDQASVNQVMRAAVGRATDALYENVAEANWDTIAGQFNAAAEAFTKAHQTVAATTAPASLVTASDRIRKAWAEGQSQRAALDGLIGPLLAAARLAGTNATGKTWEIGATLDAGNLHRRRVWEAWDSENRWTALLDLNATIQAPELDNLTPYREPAPMENRLERGGIGFVNVEYDPEDNVPTDSLTAQAVENHLNGVPTP
ncbi:hypothetical protein AB0230_12295 [Microbacterium sp. NPDC089190]|uniref:hypothetical protein n=1 Tax=Microbacterium sp. NPDC089190 TaxID=3155063 RepID=UPI0034501580